MKTFLRLLLLALLVCAVAAACITLIPTTSPDPLPAPKAENTAAAVTPEASSAPEVSPEPSPEATPELSTEEKALAILQSMTPEQKAWQMMYVFPQDVSGQFLCTDPEVWADSVNLRPAGGIVVSYENMDSARQVKDMLACIKSAAALTPFLGVDEEGGVVERLAYAIPEALSLKPMFTYRELGEDGARSNAKAIAEDIASFGFNQDFAPVADVWTNPENTVIGKRAYSDEPEECARLVSAAVEGFAQGGVISTLKHFPGHGDTAEDSHYSTAVSHRTLDELASCELLPFIAGMDSGAGMIMTGHISLPELDSQRPATLSPAIVDGLLRGDLGWDGVVITDSFAMAAISGEYGVCEAAVMAVEAGCDMILGADRPEEVVAALLEKIAPERIDQSVLRILTLKINAGIIR